MRERIMNRTVAIIVVVGLVLVALIFAFNQTGTDDGVVQPEVTEVVPEPDTTENLDAPATETPAPSGTEAPATGNPAAPQQ
jgi:hypothetical protein